MRLLYADAEASSPEGKLYEIPGIRNSRDGIKKPISSAICNDKEPQKMPKGVRPLRWDGGSYYSIMKLIKEYHYAVADDFYKGLGVTLMRKESMS